jgi:hypothetical protein
MTIWDKSAAGDVPSSVCQRPGQHRTAAAQESTAVGAGAALRWSLQSTPCGARAPGPHRASRPQLCSSPPSPSSSSRCWNDPGSTARSSTGLLTSTAARTHRPHTCKVATDTHRKSSAPTGRHLTAAMRLAGAAAVSGQRCRLKGRLASAAAARSQVPPSPPPLLAPPDAGLSELCCQCSLPGRAFLRSLVVRCRAVSSCVALRSLWACHRGRGSAVLQRRLRRQPARLLLLCPLWPALPTAADVRQDRGRPTHACCTTRAYDLPTARRRNGAKAGAVKAMLAPASQCK